jgi:hypothetical protein
MSTIYKYCRLNKLEDYNKIKAPTKEEIIGLQTLYDKLGSTHKVAENTKWSKSTVLKYVKTKKRKKYKNIKEKNVAGVKNWRKRTKQKLIEYKGGKCIKCGYDKCIRALEFHHRNPNEKEFAISYKGETKKIEKLLEEVDKCDLLCANCHRETHYNIEINKES